MDRRQFLSTTVAGSFLRFEPPPNIVFILADDLGYGDVGCFGQQKIRTPNIDKLAASGIRFTRHYSGSPVCAPSRGVLMTGLHSGHAVIRNNKEIQPEGQPPLPAGTQTLARLLQKSGYRTGCFGKWGLGFPGSPGEPLRQGFDRFFGYNCQRHAHNYYPTYLWDNDRRRPIDNPDFSPHQQLPQDLDPKDAASYRAYIGRHYSPDLIAEEARSFVRASAGRPFFLWMTTTVPHLALQVPEDSLAEYLGKFPETPYKGQTRYLPHRAPRAAYAAMITRMDREVGRLRKLIEELGLGKRTIFVFASDNGPVYDQHGGTDCDFFNSNGGLNGRKGSVYEGGMRVPMMVSWPGRISAGTQSDRVTGFEDWLPTICELAGVQPGAAVDGISFAPTLMGQKQTVRPFLYREFPAYGGQQCLLAEDWKLIRRDLVPSAGTQPKTELYNLASDPHEGRDVATANPAVVARLTEIAREQHRNSDLFPFPALDK
ncbi:MAG: N-acetylgalactosamine-6-sulfatase [Acidobacteria bacterium]|nr:MAG: N-acetylgalactosamine-6-sulfatase [Acidobacteriota bacterium]